MQGFKSGCNRERIGSHAETLTQIEFPAEGIVDEKITRAFTFDFAFEKKIGAIHDIECLTHVVVCD